MNSPHQLAIALDFDDSLKAYLVNRHKKVFEGMLDDAAATWTELPGWAADVAVSGDGKLWKANLITNTDTEGSAAQWDGT